MEKRAILRVKREICTDNNGINSDRSSSPATFLTACTFSKEEEAAEREFQNKFQQITREKEGCYQLPLVNSNTTISSNDQRSMAYAQPTLAAALIGGHSHSNMMCNTVNSAPNHNNNTILVPSVMLDISNGPYTPAGAVLSSSTAGVQSVSTTTSPLNLAPPTQCSPFPQSVLPPSSGSNQSVVCHSIDGNGATTIYANDDNGNRYTFISLGQGHPLLSATGSACYQLTTGNPSVGNYLANGDIQCISLPTQNPSQTLVSNVNSAGNKLSHPLAQFPYMLASPGGEYLVSSPAHTPAIAAMPMHLASDPVGNGGSLTQPSIILLTPGTPHPSSNSTFVSLPHSLESFVVPKSEAGVTLGMKSVIDTISTGSIAQINRTRSDDGAKSASPVVPLADTSNHCTGNSKSRNRRTNKTVTIPSVIPPSECTLTSLLQSIKPPEQSFVLPSLATTPQSVSVVQPGAVENQSQGRQGTNYGDRVKDEHVSHSENPLPLDSSASVQTELSQSSSNQETLLSKDSNDTLLRLFRKRQRNRDAARRCRDRKNQKLDDLESEVQEKKRAIIDATRMLHELMRHNELLRQTIRRHVQECGCQLEIPPGLSDSVFANTVQLLNDCQAPRSVTVLSVSNSDDDFMSSEMDSGALITP